MQRGVSKNLIILSLFFFGGIIMASAQVSTHRLSEADSLFKAKRYTQSLEQYRIIFQQKQFSPAMLLKMAYIEEGLQRTGDALYYLNLYYNVTNDKTVLEKMEELANKHNLQGYEQTDAGRFLSFYNDYHLPVGVGLMALAVFLLSLSFYLKRKKEMLWPSMTAFVVVLGLLVVHNTLGEQAASGIVSQENTYLMDGPSPGATVISVVESGHRVEILGKKDVWIKIRWKGETAYIKQNHLLPLSL
ncbi:MAG TPA: SH3 domain-containing protein [Ohtaekwangia sp.]|uniref:SH3 domain-containing protein n=1 Tax=Ohtaekwangia sp. TaxID=2066019 RepID=UPI002F930AEE